MKKRQASQVICKASKAGNAVRERQAAIRESAARLTNLERGDKFKRDGKLWQVFSTMHMEGNIWNALCFRVNQKTGSTFGKCHAIPFKSFTSNL